jgi:zinc and cadmium transporter
MSPLAQAVAATLLVSALSLIGIVFAFRDWSARIEIASISFAAGVLLATAFLELLPEAIHHAGDGEVLGATLAAIAFFFGLERLIHGVHGDHAHAADLPHDHSGHSLASRYLILVGDSLHNFIDGAAIAAAFLASPALGISTAVAVAAHEIPHELADYSILVSSRLDRVTALVLNFATALTALVGVAACYLLQDFVLAHLHWFMAATAGMFIYIGAAGLIPQIHHSRWRRSWLCTGPFFGGIALMVVIAALVPHPG